MLARWKKITGLPLIERVTLYISLFILAPLIPLTGLRAYQLNWPLAAFDAFIGFMAALIFVCTYKKYKSHYMPFALCLLIAGATIAIFSVGNVNHLFYLFPAFTSWFFLSKPKIALALTVVVNIILIPFVIDYDKQVLLSFYSAFVPSVLFIFFCAKALRLQHENLNNLATVDFLTQSGNRRAFQQDKDACMLNFNRHKIPCSLILLDMDHFKRLNDQYGHSIGDRVLQHVAKTINIRLRRTDKLYRLGGEEFAVLLSHSSLKESLLVAKDLQNYLAKNANPDLPAFTISIGLSQLKLGESGEDWLMRTDKALYQSKEDGRDTITAAH